MRDTIMEATLAEMAKQVGDIYHFANHKIAERIIDSGKFISQTGHISTTRNFNLPLDPDQKGGDLHYSKGYNTRLTLDGNKISERHRIKPLLGVTANVTDPDNHHYNKHRVSGHEHENEEMVKHSELPIHNILKHVHVVPDSIEAKDHYHNVLKPKLDKLGISSSIGKKFHRSHISESSFSDIELNECFVIEF